MKLAGFPLLFSAGSIAVSLGAQSTTSIVSRETSARIREGLPTYAPSPPPSDSATEPTQTTDPDVLILPKVTVKGKRLPPDAADHLMSRRDFKRKMENLYLDALAEDGPLNVLLNNFTIPILSPSKAQRGRALYHRRELDRLRRVNDATRAIAPEAADKFKDELDNTHTTRPAGGLHNK